MDSSNTNEAYIPTVDPETWNAVRAHSRPQDPPPVGTYGPHNGWRGLDNSPWTPLQASARHDNLPRERPTGVTVIAVLNLVAAFVLGLICWWALSEGLNAGILWFILLVDIVFTTVVGVGLLLMKKWAYTLALVGYGINIALSVLDMLGGPVQGATLVGIAVSGFIIWYLRQPHVAEVFE